MLAPSPGGQWLMAAQAEVLAILGTGNEAHSHYNVFTEIFPFKEVGYNCLRQYSHTYYSNLKLWVFNSQCPQPCVRYLNPNLLNKDLFKFTG